MNYLRQVFSEAVVKRGNKKYLSRGGSFYRYDSEGNREVISQEEYLRAVRERSPVRRLDVEMGKVVYRGMRVRQSARVKGEGQNLHGEILLGEKFWDLSPKGQEHVLKHEWAHSVADDIMAENPKEVYAPGVFIERKPYPKGHKKEGEFYYEGLYGDVGGTALSETVTEAIVEYEDNPEALRRRSEKAFTFLDIELRRRSLDG